MRQSVNRDRRRARPARRARRDDPLRRHYLNLLARAQAGELFLVPQGVAVTPDVLAIAAGRAIVEVPPWAWDLMQVNPNQASDFHYDGSNGAEVPSVPTPVVPTRLEPFAPDASIPPPPPVPAEDVAPEAVETQAAPPAPQPTVDAPAPASEQATAAAVPSTSDAIATIQSNAAPGIDPLNVYATGQTPAPWYDPTRELLYEAGGAFMNQPPTPDELIAENAVLEAKLRALEEDAAQPPATTPPPPGTTPPPGTDPSGYTRSGDQVALWDAWTTASQSGTAPAEFVALYNSQNGTNFTTQDLARAQPTTNAPATTAHLWERWKAREAEGWTVNQFLAQYNKNYGTSFDFRDLARAQPTTNPAGTRAHLLERWAARRAEGWSPEKFIFNYNKNYQTTYTAADLR